MTPSFEFSGQFHIHPKKGRDPQFSSENSQKIGRPKYRSHMYVMIVEYVPIVFSSSSLKKNRVFSLIVENFQKQKMTVVL